MTTIAWRDGVLACDSRAMANGWVSADGITKMVRLKDGRIAAVTGDFATGMEFTRWADKAKATDQPRPELPDSRVVIVGAKGPIEIYEEKGFFKVPRKAFHAWGSGAPAAMAAMHCGKTAAEAVHVAMKVDPNTGGRVRSLAV